MSNDEELRTRLIAVVSELATIARSPAHPTDSLDRAVGLLDNLHPHRREPVQLGDLMRERMGHWRALAQRAGC